MNTRKAIRAVMAAYVATFVAAALVFLLATGWTLRQAERAGAVTGTHLFLAATMGLMAMLVHVSILVWRDPVRHRGLLPVLAVSKFTSSAAAVVLWLWHAEPGLLAVVAADLPLGLVAAALWRMPWSKGTEP